ncbi:MAG TPA: DNA repair protein RecO [Xanthomonadaceae bacterium]|nr:DNA repair protein RecO [Xanthomonadaceae bacterium]
MSAGTVLLEPAFVLHARAYRETSLLLEAFSRAHGRIGLIARGVRGPRAQSTRALLQPLQRLRMSWRGRGELPLMTAVEADALYRDLTGDTVLAGLYVNELILRLLPRADPHPELFDRYSQALAELSSTAAPAWSLRRFERDLVIALGYGLPLATDSEGRPVQPQARYRYDPEHGPVATTAAAGPLGGTALLALAQDRAPDAAGLRELRRMMRRVLRFHLGGRDLESWRVLPELVRRRSRP